MIRVLREHLVMKLLVCICLVLCATQAPGQTKGDKSKNDARPDLTGTWMLDLSKIKLGRSKNVSRDYAVKLVITHQDPEMRITRTITSNNNVRSQHLTYYTDGRGETNPGGLRFLNVRGSDDSDKLTTKTKWDGARLVSRASTSTTVLRETFYVDMSEKRELSSDGQLLTITISISMSGAPEVIMYVFNRVQ